MITAIIQARWVSPRLPGKVLKPIFGKPMLEHLLLRAKRANTLDKIIVATTDNPEDKAVAELAEKCGVGFFCGSEKDVLDRYYQAVKIRQPADDDAIVRITGDCPLADPKVIDDVVNFYLQNQDKYDYVSNVHPPTYPDGMDAEVFPFKLFERVWKEARLESEREHVTPYFYNHPEIFRIGNRKYKKDVSAIRLTVDNPEDLILVEKVFSAVSSKNPNFGLEEILEYLEQNPDLLGMNKHIQRNKGYKKSLTEDLKQY